MSRFPPTPNILASVTMTRTAYAQLMGQRFQQPRVFGLRNTSITEGSKEARWWDIGVKLVSLIVTFQSFGRFIAGDRLVDSKCYTRRLNLAGKPLTSTTQHMYVGEFLDLFQSLTFGLG